MILSFEEQFVLGSIKIQLTEDNINHLNNLVPKIRNWESVLHIAVGGGIGPLLYKKLSCLTNKNLIPSGIIEKLTESYFLTLRRSMILQNQFEKILDIFKTNNLPVIALKGIFLSEWLYNDIGLRQFSDIDLLVPAENGVSCIHVLNSIGFVERDYNPVSEFIQSKSDNVHFSPMIYNSVSVELHTKLHQDTQEYSLSPESCWQSAVTYNIRGKEILGLQLYDLMIHVCVHLDRHFKEGQVQFTCFNDIANLVDKYGGKLDWNAFINRCRNFKAELVVMKYIILVHKYCSVALPEDLSLKYSYLLGAEDEKLFIKYLRGYSNEMEPETHIPVHLANLKKLNNISDLLKYVFQIIFPPKKFMIMKYYPQPLKGSISSPLGARGYFWWLWYPYRWYVGMKGVAKLFFRGS